MLLCFGLCIVTNLLVEPSFCQHRSVLRNTELKALGNAVPDAPLDTRNAAVIGCSFPWTEEPGGLQSTGSQRVGQDWSSLAHIFYHNKKKIPFNIIPILLVSYKFYDFNIEFRRLLNHGYFNCMIVIWEISRYYLKLYTEIMINMFKHKYYITVTDTILHHSLESH